MAPAALHIGPDGWLAACDAPAVIRVPTVRTTTLLDPEPLALVWHWTAGDYAPDHGHADSVSLAKWIAERPPATEPGASWHILIDKDGALVQSAPVVVGTWHVGKPGAIRGRTVLNVNRCTVGVEFENAGRLEEHDGRFYAWPYRGADGKPSPKYEVDRSRAQAGRGGLFDAFTAAQETSAELLVRALVERFRWPREAFTYGHVHFDFPRKTDPGPIWLEEILPRLLSRVFPPTVG
jgi:hypothetical protein